MARFNDDAADGANAFAAPGRATGFRGSRLPRLAYGTRGMRHSRSRRAGPRTGNFEAIGRTGTGAGSGGWSRTALPGRSRLSRASQEHLRSSGYPLYTRESRVFGRPVHG